MFNAETFDGVHRVLHSILLWSSMAVCDVVLLLSVVDGAFGAALVEINCRAHTHTAIETFWRQFKELAT